MSVRKVPAAATETFVAQLETADETFVLPAPIPGDGYPGGRKVVIDRVDSSNRVLTVGVPAGDRLDGVLNATASVAAATRAEFTQARPGTWQSPESGSGGLTASQIANDPTVTAAFASVRAVSTVFVDPIAGNDTNDGVSWKRAVSSLQHACDIATPGAEIILADTDHDVLAGVTVAASKCLTISGVHPLKTRQHATSNGNQARLTSSLTGGSRPTFYLQLGTSATSTNVYGWTIRHLYIDGDRLADGGAAIEAHAVNRCVVDDVTGRQITTNDNRYIVKAGPGSGNDASWWTIRNVVTYGMRISTSQASNYWSWPQSTALGVTASPRLTGPAIRVFGSSQPDISGVAFEGWDVAAEFDTCRGVMAFGPRNEWVGTAVNLISCYDSIVALNSAAGAGNSEVIDDGGSNNMVIGATLRRVNNPSQSFGLSSAAVSPAQLPGGYISPLYGTNPGKPPVGSELLPMNMIDLAAVSAMTASYFDGAVWQPWTVDTTPAVTTNNHAVDIDPTHKNCRFKIGSTGGLVQGLVYARINQPLGGAGTVKVRTYDSDATTVLQEFVTPYVSPGNLRGIFCSLGGLYGGSYIELELDLAISGGQVANLQRLHVYATEAAGSVRGRHSQGRPGPEGVIYGSPGDYYECVGVTLVDPDIGLYMKLTGSDTVTGWGKCPFVSVSG